MFESLLYLRQSVLGVFYPVFPQKILLISCSIPWLKLQDKCIPKTKSTKKNKVKHVFFVSISPFFSISYSFLRVEADFEKTSAYVNLHRDLL